VASFGFGTEMNVSSFTGGGDIFFACYTCLTSGFTFFGTGLRNDEVARFQAGPLDGSKHSPTRMMVFISFGRLGVAVTVKFTLI
jgi:hypothetical protein